MELKITRLAWNAGAGWICDICARTPTSRRSGSWSARAVGPRRYRPGISKC